MQTLLVGLMTPALISLALAAIALVLFNDWRIRLTALAVQYTAAAILVTQAVRLEVAFAKFVVGGLVVAILVITAAQFNFGRPNTLATGVAEPEADAAAPERRFEVPTGFPFRALAVLMFVIAALYLASQPSLILPGLQVAPALNIASYLLMALGLLNLGLSEEPIRAGTSLLTLMIGFESFYAAVEPSLAIVALLAAAEFGVALAISYLTVHQRTEMGEAVNE